MSEHFQSVINMPCASQSYFLLLNKIVKNYYCQLQFWVLGESVTLVAVSIMSLRLGDFYSISLAFS